MSILNPTIKASTLSVLMNENDSITCYVEINEESCNVTLRLEDDKARLAGFPADWKTWDEPIDPHSGNEYTYQDAENDATIESFVHEIESIDVYISRNIEKEIFNQLKQSLVKQFADEMFKDQLSSHQKELALAKIDLAVASL